MFPIVLIMSILCQGRAVDYGVEFVTAFPENLAYYFPAELYLTLKITTFLPNTSIQIFMNGTSLNQSYITHPLVFTVNISGAEVNQFGVSVKSIRIVSNKNITVLSINKRGDSIQANVVLPTTHLGVEYLVPSHNYTELAAQLNTYDYSVFTDLPIVPMDFSYRLLIINAVNASNSVTVTKKTPKKEEDTEITLGPFELTQLPSDAFWFKVSSTAQVAVIFTNPCIDTKDCRCNLVAHQLRPTTFLGTEFIFPPFSDDTNRLVVTSADSVELSCGSEKNTVAPGSIELLPYFPAQATGSPSFTTSVPASVRVIHPGIIIDLLPKTSFSSCYLVHTNIQASAFVILIAETATKTDTHMGSVLLSSVTWNDIGDAGYSWVSVDLNSCKSCVFWHPTSKIAVYVFEYSESSVLYGGPAISVNDEPDPNGCVVVPTEYILSNVTSSWQASRAYCISKGLILASPSMNFTQQKMVAALNSMNAEGDAWLGLRRSLVTSEWYWHNNVNFGFAHWERNQPSGSMCVSMRMEPKGNFTWSSVRCCSSLFPLCARDMVILSVINDWSVYPSPSSITTISPGSITKLSAV